LYFILYRIECAEECLTRACVRGTNPNIAESPSNKIEIYGNDAGGLASFFMYDLRQAHNVCRTGDLREIAGPTTVPLELLA
jgi:hypothetical protein